MSILLGATEGNVSLTAELSSSGSLQFPVDSPFQRFNEIGTNGFWLNHVVNGTHPLRPFHAVDVIELAGHFAHLF